jgi:hypothetical protein
VCPDSSCSTAWRMNAVGDEKAIGEGRSRDRGANTRADATRVCSEIRASH